MITIGSFVIWPPSSLTITPRLLLFAVIGWSLIGAYAYLAYRVKKGTL